MGTGVALTRFSSKGASSRMPITRDHTEQVPLAWPWVVSYTGSQARESMTLAPAARSHKRLAKAPQVFSTYQLQHASVGAQVQPSTCKAGWYPPPCRQSTAGPQSAPTGTQVNQPSTLH